MLYAYNIAAIIIKQIINIVIIYNMICTYNVHYTYMYNSFVCIYM